MTETLLLAGLLADPLMIDALGLTRLGPPLILPGRLVEVEGAGLSVQGWPLWDRDAAGSIAAVPVAPNGNLQRYAEIMALTPMPSGSGPVLGLRLPEPGAALAAKAAAEPPILAVAVTRDLLAQPANMPAETLRARLPMIAVWAASRMRARQERGAGAALGPDDDDRLRIETRDEPYARFFTVQQMGLRHRLHRGGWSDLLDRAVFVSGDAVVVLPWDPRRDRVLLVDQFRAGPAARDDPQPWLYEPVAGRIDAGETPESTARREAVEEAGVTLGQLFAVPAHYPSPGIAAEYIYGFIGTADLPDGAGSVLGLESEGEDIRGHVIARDELTRMVMDGRVANGPLMILALWLDRKAAGLRATLAAS